MQLGRGKIILGIAQIVDNTPLPPFLDSIVDIGDFISCRRIVWQIVKLIHRQFCIQ